MITKFPFIAVSVPCLKEPSPVLS